MLVQALFTCLSKSSISLGSMWDDGLLHLWHAIVADATLSSLPSWAQECFSLFVVSTGFCPACMRRHAPESAWHLASAECAAEVQGGSCGWVFPAGHILVEHWHEHETSSPPENCSGSILLRPTATALLLQGCLVRPSSSPALGPALSCVCRNHSAGQAMQCTAWDQLSSK